MIDTGNLSLNLIDFRLYLLLCQQKHNSIRRTEEYKILAANHSRLNLIGQTSEPITVIIQPQNPSDDALEIELKPFIAKDISSPLILNLATLNKIGAIINLPDKLLSVNSGMKTHHYPLMEKIPVRKQHPVFLSRSQKVTIPANTEVRITASTNNNLDYEVYFEPDESFQSIHHLHVSCSISQGSKSSIPIKIKNSEDHPITIKPHTTIGKLSRYSDLPDPRALVINAFHTNDELNDFMNEEPKIDPEIQESKDHNDTGNTTIEDETNKLIIRLYSVLGFAKESCKFTEDEKWILIQVFLQNKSALALIDDEVGDAEQIQCKIDTGTHPPFQSKSRPLNPDLLQDLKEQLEKWIRQKIVEKSNSSWSSPLVAVLKKNKQVRWCCDFRRLNQISKYDARPVSSIQQSLSQLHHDPPYTHFCVCDLAQAYFSCYIEPSSREKTAFTCPFGLYQYRKLAFGLQAAPAVYHELVTLMKEKIEELDPNFAKQLQIYFDDCLIAGTNFQELVDRINIFLFMIKSLKLKISIEKCVIQKDEIPFLGNLVTSSGISLDSKKVAALKNWPVPTAIDQVRGIHGLMNQYRKFIRNFAARTFNIRQKLKMSNATNHWDDKCEAEKQDILNCLSKYPILAHPQYGPNSQKFLLQIDTSRKGIGAVLKQKQFQYDQKLKQKVLVERTISYGSRRLTEGEQSYSSFKLEMAGLITSIENFRFYLLRKDFVIQTDNRALAWILKTKNPSLPPLCFRWLQRLEFYRPYFTIEFIPGRSNTISDSLSRRDYFKDDFGDMSQPKCMHESLWNEDEFDYATARESMSDTFWLEVMKTNMKKRQENSLHLHTITRNQAKLQKAAKAEEKEKAKAVKVKEQKSKREARQAAMKARFENLPKRITRASKALFRRVKDIVLQPRNFDEEAEETEEEKAEVEQEAELNQKEEADIEKLEDDSTDYHEENLINNDQDTTEEQKEEQERDQEEDQEQIPEFDLEQEIQFPEIITPGSSACIEWIKKCQNQDMCLSWLKLNYKSNLAILDAVNQVFGNMPEENRIGYFSTLYRARRRMKVKDDILKIQQNTELFQKELLVLNARMTKDLVHIIHTSEGTSHFGTSKTAEIFNQYFFCPGALNYITKYISSCKPCIDAKKLELGKPELGRVGSLSHPRLKYWSIDLVKMPLSSPSKYQYIMTLLDQATLWLECYCLRSKHAQPIADILIHQFIPRYGFQNITYTIDNGKEFLNATVKEAMEKIGGGIQYAGLAYHSQSLHVERHHRTLLNFIRALLIDKELKKEKWPLVLSNALYNHRSMPNNGSSAFYRVYGIMPKTQLSSILNIDPNDNNRLKVAKTENEEDEDELDQLYPSHHLKSEDIKLDQSESHLMVKAPGYPSRKLFKVRSKDPDVTYLAQYINTLDFIPQKIVQKFKNKSVKMRHDYNKKFYGKSNIVFIPNELVDIRLFIDPESASSRKLKRNWASGYCIDHMIHPLEYSVRKLNPDSWRKTSKLKKMHVSNLRPTLQISFQQRRCKKLPWAENDVQGCTPTLKESAELASDAKNVLDNENNVSADSENAIT